MTNRDAVMTALDALRLHKLRSALTMLGIIIGVAAVIAMMAVGGGAREQVVAQIRSSTSSGRVPVLVRSPRTASAPICEEPSPSPFRMRRSLMPVRSVIQASVVSTMRARSALVSTSGGT